MIAQIIFGSLSYVLLALWGTEIEIPNVVT